MNQPYTDSPLEILLAEVAALQAEVNHLREKMEVVKVQLLDASLATAPRHPSPPAENPSTTSTTAQLSRGRLLRTGITGLAAALGVAIVGSQNNVRAANGASFVLGSEGNAATAPTGLAVSQPYNQYGYGLGVADGTVDHFVDSATLAAYVSGTYASAVLGDASRSGATGVTGFSQSGFGVYGISDHGNGVGAFTSDANAGALLASNLSGGPAVLANGDSVGVRASSTYGESVWGEIQSSANSSAAVLGTTFGSGAGVQGTSARGVGVVGVGATDGLNSTGTSGRGAVFAGKAAQVQLVPSTAKTHPKTGKLGDLFVDSSKRLWFCHGGSHWRQIA